jgi:hypothetical protein
VGSPLYLFIEVIGFSSYAEDRQAAARDTFASVGIIVSKFVKRNALLTAYTLNQIVI